MMNQHIKIIVIDLFSGAGGFTEGIEMARDEEGRKVATVIAAVNHDAVAIASHQANHPETKHFVEDIRTLDVAALTIYVNQQKKNYPNAKVLLHASLECTNHSNAKGGLPRDRDSRTLANDLFRYIDALAPDYITIENVREFMAWGEIDEKGKPISRDKGRDYIRWTNNVQKRKYNFNWRLLNSANYGAHTSRTRYFAIFSKPGLPNLFPTQTHAKRVDGMFDDLEKWRPVKEVLDFEDEGESIFTRKKPLVENTLKRIYAGLLKFVANGEEKWILKYFNHGNGQVNKGWSLKRTAPTITTQGRLQLVSPCFITKYYSGNPKNRIKSIEEPADTITTVDHHSLVNCDFLTSYYGNGNAHSVDDACPTITTHDRFNKIEASFHASGASQFLDQQYGNSLPQAVEGPINTITTNPKHNLVTTKHHYLMNPQYSSKGSSVNAPCFTLIARMDKMPPYLMTAVGGGQIGIIINKSDCPTMIKIKAFMAEFGIIDIKMRMLRIKELKAITGFPEDYILKGTKTDQKKFIGNAVTCIIPQRMMEVLGENL